jgi:uncharacterized protein with ATP-grasp and redox domains
MLIWSDCIPCSLRLALGMARSAFSDEDEVASFLREVTAMPAFARGEWDLTSPHLTGDIWRLLVERTGQADPMAEVKAMQNQAAQGLFDAARKHVLASADPFTEALKLSILGNAIDAMVDTDAAPDTQLLESLACLSVDEAATETFRGRLDSARRIAWFSDNCGEVVFDGLLLEQIRSRWDPEITYITHTVPVLNDALLEDARAAGLEKFARVIENGARRALPGNLVGQLGAQPAQAVAAADLVVSKGVANFELLSWEGALQGRVTYLLHAKCHPVCSVHEVKRGELIVHNG